MILNSFLIIPLFTHILNTKEVSIYLIALQILNLICTLSFDWIAKAIVRFYEKYDIQDKQEIFLSSIFWIAVVVYIIIFVLYFLFKNILISNFAVTNAIFGLTILLAIPCGIRQALYQILRAKNYYMLYTGSIILYQFLFIAGFCGLVNLLPNASSIILSMLLSIVFIDIYIYRSLGLKSYLKFSFSKKILTETLKYSIPLVITSFCYWALFHTPKLVFQNSGEYLNTSVLGIAWTLATNTINPIASLFMFVNFPVIIKNFEHNKSIKIYITSLLQLFLFILTPLLCGVCLFTNDIIRIILPNKYSMCTELLPIFVIIIFAHEMMKVINIKYHLHNKTYIETLFGVVISAVCCLLYLYLANLTPAKAAYIMLAAEIILISANIIIKFNNFNFINYKKTLLTASYILLISFICGFTANLFFSGSNYIICFFKIAAYLCMTYSILYSFRKKILL